MEKRENNRFARWWGRLVCLAGCIGGVGCASPGVPLPPSLKLPEPARGLTAERISDEVRLHWTTSPETTDGQTIKGKIVAVVCREERVPGPCIPVDRREVMPGSSEVDLKLVGGSAQGPARLLGFRVALENAKGRSEGETPPVYVAGGKAPATVDGLRVTATREGALLRWQRVQDGSTVEVRRKLAEVNSSAPAEVKAGPFGGTKDTEAALVLRAGTTDVGGMTDRDAVRSVKYRYTAQRVVSVRVGGRDMLLRGPESSAVVWTLQDVFPPTSPTGLVAVLGPDSIDLAWDSGDTGAKADLAGYFVVRRVGDGPERRLNAEAITGPGFRDMTVIKGITYRYRVTAVDRSGNESKPSEEVRESLR